MVGENEYVVDYDRRGMIRARFIVQESLKPWAIIDMLDAKVKAKFAGANLFRIKRTTFDLDINKVQWSVKWEYPGYTKRNEVSL